MGLVDYSSGDSSSDSDAHHDGQQPPAKKRKSSVITSHPPKFIQHQTEGSPTTTTIATTTTTTLPPLPSSFHNLYATTVRPFTADLPSLHQGRKRLIPHVDGNWPSHIYVEWHPSPAHHAALTSLLAALAHELNPLLCRGSNGNGNATATTTATTTTTTLLHPFLTSDLGAPLPLHVSLSRPFVLRTDQKATFHDALAASLARAAVPPFTLRADGLAWFRSAEAARSFLVLRVRTSHCDSHYQQQGSTRTNPQLAALLMACNALVAAYGQPQLYVRGGRGSAGAGKDHDGAEHGGGDGGGGVQPVVEEEDGEGEGPEGAFHVSVAWTFAEPTEEIRARTDAVFAREEGRNGVVGDIRIPVDGVKVKIGNVVSTIALAEKGRKNHGGGMGLFGI